MTRHGLVAPPLVPSGNGSPPRHGRPRPIAIGVDERSAGRLLLWRKGPDLDFRIFEAGRSRCPTTTQPPASTASTTSPSRGSATSSGPGRAAGTSGRAILPPGTHETHNNQSAVDATTPLCQMSVGAGGGGRGAPAMAPGHPRAVGTRGRDVRAWGSAKTEG